MHFAPYTSLLGDCAHADDVHVKEAGDALPTGLPFLGQCLKPIQVTLRKPDDLSTWIEQAGLCVVDRLTTRARHGKALREDDPLHAARSEEITSLWRLSALPAL